MRSIRFAILCLALTFIITIAASAQADKICAEAGYTPSLDSPFAQVPYLYGTVVVSGVRSGDKIPRVTVSLADSRDRADRLTLSESGNYCFKRRGSGGTLVVEVDGVEVARRQLPAFGAAQQREDFEVRLNDTRTTLPPGAVSAKFSYPPNEKTQELYQRAADAEKARNLGAAAELLAKVVTVDPADFIAWAKLGTIYFELERFDEAEAAFRKSIELKPEYTPSWINAGKLRVARKQLEAAIEVFKHAVELDPTSARTFQLLGEAYLHAKQGTLGAQALNEALRLDPVGMAECHLLLAKLYDLAGARDMASREYLLFLQKVPQHPDRKKLESYIKQHPPKP